MFNSKKEMFFITAETEFGSRLWMDDHWVDHAASEENDKLFGWIRGFATQEEAENFRASSVERWNAMHENGPVDGKGKPLTGRAVTQHYSDKVVLELFDGAAIKRVVRSTEEVA